MLHPYKREHPEVEYGLSPSAMKSPSNIQLGTMISNNNLQFRMSSQSKVKSPIEADVIMSAKLSFDFTFFNVSKNKQKGLPAVGGGKSLPKSFLQVTAQLSLLCCNQGDRLNGGCDFISCIEGTQAKSHCSLRECSNGAMGDWSTVKPGSAEDTKLPF